MDVLILGGTKFVGRHVARAFRSAGARVALFNRGNRYGEPLAGFEEIRGDRLRDLHRTGTRTWDAVVDMCAYLPRDAHTAARFFADKTSRYLLVSTISVYDLETTGRVDEDAPLARLAPQADRNRMTPQTYGALKAACENIILSAFRERATIVRPGLVAGPYDPTDRFTYWPLRIADSGQVLLPHEPAHPIQYIDASDLAAFTVKLVRDDRPGIFNAVTTPGTQTFGSLFGACARASGTVASPVYAAEQALLDAGVQPWSDLPLWIPSFVADSLIVRVPNTRARAAGLTLRPVDETVRAVLGWARRTGKRSGRLNAGLSRAHESRLLSA